MKALKKSGLFLLLLAVACCLTACFGSAYRNSQETPKDDFAPVVRFAVTSDVHIRSYDTAKSPQDYQSHEILKSFCESAYAYSASQSYNKLDAIFFVGDFAQTGYDDEFEDFFNIIKEKTKEETQVRAILGNHEFRATRYDDGTNRDDRYSKTSVAATFEKYLKYGEYEEADAHLLVGGYHCIVLNMDLYADYVKFTPERLAWLEKRLSIAAKEDPTGEKPIFVFQHVPAAGTVNNITSGGDTKLREVLNKYPQVVDFSGHSHRPITDPRSIWQGEFTAINTGGLAYLSISLVRAEKTVSVRAMDHNGAWASTSDETEIRNAGLYYFVEINAKHEVRLVAYNLYTNAVDHVVSLGKVGAEKNLGSFEERAAASTAPSFSENAAISTTFIGKNRAILSIPQANCTAGVSTYRVELYQDSNLVSTTYRLSCSHLGAAMPTHIAAPLEALTSSTAYTVKVFPVSSWAKEGSPLQYSFTTKAADLLQPDVFSAAFSSDGSATNRITGEALRVHGAPSVYYDSTLGKSVASFDGSSSYAFSSMYDTYAAITDGFALETYLYMDAPVSGTVCPLGGMQSGGFGLQIKNGELQFLVYTGNKAYERASAPMVYGAWVHIVGCFDGERITLFMNGEKVSETAASAPTWGTPSGGAKYLVIGGDATNASYVGTSFTKCKHATVSLYSTALTEAEVQEVYRGLK